MVIKIDISTWQRKGGVSMKVKIGVTPLFKADKKIWWMVPGYMEAILKVGGIPIMIPLTDDKEILDEIFNNVDGFLFTGGQDINPQLYNEEKKEMCGYQCDTRDNQEVYLMRKALELDKPLLGICRGVQLLNVVTGGTLYQDIGTEINRGIKLVHKQKHPYNKGTHEVNIQKGTILYDALGKEKLIVNSLHHQGIKTIRNDVAVNAVATDGLIEGIEIPKAKFAMAVQWHPEFMFCEDKFQEKIFSLLVESCMN